MTNNIDILNPNELVSHLIQKMTSISSNDSKESSSSNLKVLKDVLNKSIAILNAKIIENDKNDYTSQKLSDEVIFSMDDVSFIEPRGCFTPNLLKEC